MAEENKARTQRVFPPLYQSSGRTSEDRLAFFHVLERLKTQKRTGWVDRKVNHIYLLKRLFSHRLSSSLSISDHMYRMAMLAMCSSDTSIDTTKCVLMCLVHDLAEAQVGDIAPREGISKAEKHRREAEAMHNFVHVMLHGSSAAQRIEALWKEYEEGQTGEARFVKDLDRFEMASQALEYEHRHKDQQLDGFFESSIPKIQHPEVKTWGEDLMVERDQQQTIRESTFFDM
ncbi:hypothetical protein M0805_001068 [Coniferiporia weirii]|nr:hypothetical protein M0805_001068 [Coniferiporia weirii]